MNDTPQPSSEQMSAEQFEQELDMLRYFWTEKGDVERYVGWKELQPVLAARRPDILKAWNDHKAAEMILSAVLEHGR